MCGICGIFTTDGAAVDPARVERMRDVMIARGPDAFGLSFGPGYALGHRRLAIIDLSDAGKQPFQSDDGELEIVFNGEIYNYRELRPELQAKGYVFRTSTDTEVLIHGFRAWGLLGLLRRVRGMFAFALLEPKARRIHLARDPLGKKPLFFKFAGGKLAFASSARALVAGLSSPPAIRLTAIDDLIENLYIPGPRTIFEGVEKLAPGFVASFDRAGRSDTCFWQPDFRPEPDLTPEDWEERVELALRLAVRRRLVADVPIGVLLSGGIDSGLITAFAAREVASLETFSVATDDPELDESGLAARVAEKYATKHHRLEVRGDLRNSLVRLVGSMGEPLADASAANVFAISELARRSVTVVLGGDGGDEAFGGYSHFLAAHIGDRIGRSVPAHTLPAIAMLGKHLPSRPLALRKFATLLRTAGQPLEQTYRSAGWIRADARRSLFTEGALAELGDHTPGAHFAAAAGDPCAPLADRVMLAHMKTVLPDDYLAKVDCASMAVSLEARCPFLDIDLVDLATKIPASIRFRGLRTKSLLRTLAERYLPKGLAREKKRGFTAPVGRWLRTDWKQEVDDLVLGPHVERRGWFRREALERAVTEHRRGENRAYLLWTLLVLELWIRITLEDGRGLN